MPIYKIWLVQFAIVRVNWKMYTVLFRMKEMFYLYIVPAVIGLCALISWVSLFLSEKKVKGQELLEHGFLPVIILIKKVINFTVCKFICRTLLNYNSLSTILSLTKWTYLWSNEKIEKKRTERMLCKIIIAFTRKNKECGKMDT